jgi:hypothetical protein
MAKVTSMTPRTGPHRGHAPAPPNDRRPNCRAISVPLATVRSGTWRSLRDSRLRRSGPLTRLDTSLCKQGVRGSSPLSSTWENDPGPVIKEAIDTRD